MPKSGWLSSTSTVALLPSRATVAAMARSTPLRVRAPSMRSSSMRVERKRASRERFTGSTSSRRLCSIFFLSPSLSAPGSSPPSFMAHSTWIASVSKRPSSLVGAPCSSPSTSMEKRATRSFRSWATAESTPSLKVKIRHSAELASKRMIRV
jgi:hypothetical protein